MLNSGKRKLLASLLDAYERKAGSFTADNGKEVTYEDADFIKFVPFEEAEVKRLAIAPKNVREVYAEIADVHWGAFVEIAIQRNEITGIRVITDALADYYETLED